MNKNAQKGKATLPPFETGQLWQMGESTLQIGLIGKTLVHFKHFKGPMKRSPVSLLNKDALARFLKTNRAVLLPAAATPPSPSAR